MKSEFEKKFTLSYGILVFIFIQIIYYINLLIAESVSISESIRLQQNPNYYVIFAALPSLFISIVILIKLHQRYHRVKNNVALTMLLFISFTCITLLSTILAYLTRGPGRLSLFFDRITFIAFVVSCYYLYLFMNEVFREPEKITMGEKAVIWIAVLAPLIITAFRQTASINKIIEGIGLGLAIIVILVPNVGIAYYSVKIARKMKRANMDTSESNKGFQYIFLSAIFEIIFTICFAIIVLEELYKTPFFYFTMVIVTTMMVLFYKGYIKPK